MIQGLCLIWCVFGFIYRMRNKRKAGKSREAGKQKSREKHNNWKSRKARKNRKAEKQRGKETEKQKSIKSKKQRSKEAEKQRAEKQENAENQRSRPAGKRGEAKKKGQAEKQKSWKAESKEAGNQKLKKHGKNKLKKIAIPLENPGLICCDDSTWPRCPVLGDTWWDASSSWQTPKKKLHPARPCPMNLSGYIQKSSHMSSWLTTSPHPHVLLLFLGRSGCKEKWSEDSTMQKAI